LHSTVTSGAGGSVQTSFGGTLDAQQHVSYSLGGSVDQQTRRAAWSANLQNRHSSGTAGLGASFSRDVRQLSASAQGALAVHAGGVTFGPYLSETFALVEAPGATGARVVNSQTRIDSRGYALVPSMTPYRYNSVILDPSDTATSAEILDGDQNVAPYAGAAVKLRFETRSGQAVLIRALQDDGAPTPFGAEVLDQAGNAIGLVGQGGRIYVRAQQPHGQLTVRWGEAASEQCVVPYQIEGQENTRVPLVRLQGVCGLLANAGARG